jgi:hypothetical protein
MRPLGDRETARPCRAARSSSEATAGESYDDRLTGDDLTARPLDDLEDELRARARVREAELVVNTYPDGRFRAAFKRPGDPMAPEGILMLEATAGTRRTALESLLAADAEPPL